ncbi:MAG: hypothetical protein IAE94_09030 [Chthoniobacterales bacterium]|nr:hypothetical protein [Chthoniobacterales bacterium]
MKPYLRITLWYLLFGGLWISLTDRLISPLSMDSVAAMTGWQTLKGWIYVFGSGGLILFLTKRAYRLQLLAEKKRLEEFQRTVRQSHHILLNYFNKMQLLILEAERSTDFDASLIGLAKEATDKATVEVRRLDQTAASDSPEDP